MLLVPTVPCSPAAIINGRRTGPQRTPALTEPTPTRVCYIGGGRLWDPTGPLELRRRDGTSQGAVSAAPVESGIAFQRYAESGPGQSKPRRLRRGRGVTPAGRY